jgi:glycosyltransferase involved in cell wall biosynthesis
MIKSNPLVSIIIPAFNAEKTITDTIRSVLDQTYKNVELIVIDDGSTDDTSAIIKFYGEQLRYVYKKNGGLASARNLGHQVASGEFIAWLDADDICHKDRITIQVSCLCANPEAILICSEFCAFDEKGIINYCHGRKYYSAVEKSGGYENLYSERKEVESTQFCFTPNFLKDKVILFKGMVHERLLFGNFIHPPTVMIRRSAIDQVGDLDTTIPTAEDYEYFLRLSKLGSVMFIAAPLLNYRCHPNQSSNNTLKIFEGLIKVRARIYAQETDFIKKNPKFAILLAKNYASASLLLAKQHRRSSFRYLMQSIKLGYRDVIHLKILTKYMIPRSLIMIKRLLYQRFSLLFIAIEISSNNELLSFVTVQG